jgi:energy-coupling factor transporter ATP-binding protein EcfA2
MMKGNEKNGYLSEKAKTYGLDYRPELEEEIQKKYLDDFESNWIQHPENQKIMLESFYGCLKRNESIIFFYAKHAPFSEPNERVIIGVAKVKNIGGLESFKFSKDYSGFRGYPWDRCIEHTLTDKDPEGFLLPYHELLEKAESIELDLSEYKVIAPDRSQFSYCSELVEHDTAIDALWRMAECLRKSGIILEKDYKKELVWIENEISRIWDMRGAFPGIGSVLSAIKMENGNSIAWEIEKYIREKDGDLFKTDPWDIFEKSMKDPDSIMKELGKELFNKTNITIWKHTPDDKKDFYKLVSRIQLDNSQAELIIGNFAETIDLAAENPYRIYEDLRIRYKGEISFGKIDKALFPQEKIRNAFPIEGKSAVEDKLDDRRIRACTVMILDEASYEGHSILPFDSVLERMGEREYADNFPINRDILRAVCSETKFQEQVAYIKEENAEFIKLQSLVEIKSVITRRINTTSLNKKYKINHDWDNLVNTYFKSQGIETESDTDKIARREKAEALNILCNNKISVLIGPAGTGKTTVLNIFEGIEEIQQGGVIKLAPTGKARVNLGHDAQTIASYLSGLQRYDGVYQIYYVNSGARKDAQARNVIIDEASMLTEEMLAAIFDALGVIDRIILVGDYRQLPPIGTGRPFVDIINLLKLKTPGAGAESGYAELKQIMRQNNDIKNGRLDIAISKCFCDEPRKEDIEILQNVSNKPPVNNPHIRFEKWYTSKDFHELFERILKDELLDDPEIDKEDSDSVLKAINATLGAKEVGGYQYFNRYYSEEMIEKWQILSPVNGYGYGVKEINKFFQQTYRKSFIDLAHNFPAGGEYRKRRIAKPKGSDNIVYGDKVISLKNHTWRNNQRIVPNDKKEEALNYFANGEIGVITGEFRGRDDRKEGEPKIEITFSTQKGYSYSFWPNELGEDGKYPFELAYAITVHKSQGSGFKKVFFVLPAGGPILSRELIYTALTRQENKIIILHQGEFRNFIRYCGTEASATARRFTDLFFLPAVKEINKRFYDARYINISERGEPMISKSEVIIANCLNKYVNEITYAYENKLEIKSSRRTIKPDFTIEHIASGRTFYWEHLGMMTMDSYREKWEKKKQGYLDDGFVIFTEVKEDDEKILILTEENPACGVDSKYFDEIIKRYILDMG